MCVFDVICLCPVTQPLGNQLINATPLRLVQVQATDSAWVQIITHIQQLIQRSYCQPASCHKFVILPQKHFVNFNPFE